MGLCHLADVMGAVGVDEFVKLFLAFRAVHPRKLFHRFAEFPVQPGRVRHSVADFSEAGTKINSETNVLQTKYLRCNE